MTADRSDPMELDKTQIRRLIPHAGAMCLIEQVLAWDENSICCLALSHCHPDNPLRSENTLPALALIEYGAQAMAIHGGLIGPAHDSPAIGYLAALHDVALHCASIDCLKMPLIIHARAEIRLDRGVVYTFWIDCEGTGVLVRGRATVAHLQPEELHENSPDYRRQR